MSSEVIAEFGTYVEQVKSTVGNVFVICLPIVFCRNAECHPIVWRVGKVDLKIHVRDGKQPLYCICLHSPAGKTGTIRLLSPSRHGNGKQEEDKYFFVPIKHIYSVA